jgi:hypothetical protein
MNRAQRRKYVKVQHHNIFTKQYHSKKSRMKAIKDFEYINSEEEPEEEDFSDEKG